MRYLARQMDPTGSSSGRDGSSDGSTQVQFVGTSDSQPLRVSRVVVGPDRHPGPTDDENDVRSSADEPRPTHLRSLTSLRFFAAVLVVVFHLSIYMPGVPTLGRLAAGGYVGVTFFFVLSGFVLTYSWDSGATATQFFRRRFARVYPVHLLFIAVAMLPLSSPYWPALPANLLLLQSWSPDDAVVRSFSSVSWSLSCEFFFYASFPLLVPWVLRVRRPLATAAALVAAALALGVALQMRGADWGLLLFHLPAFRIVEFACGALTAAALLRGWVPRLRVLWAGSWTVASYLLVLLLPIAIGYRVEDRWAFTLAMVPSFMALIAACARVDREGAPSPLQGRTLVSLGQWSFCIYMAHPAVIALTLPLLGSRSVPAAVLGCVLVVLAVIGVSYLLYTTFERPLERWLRGRAHNRVSDEVATTSNDSVPAVAPPLPDVIVTD